MMDGSLDKAYVVAQIRRASDFGLLKEAVSIVAGEKMGRGDPDWHQIRLDLDRILPGITEPRLTITDARNFAAGYLETGGYPACIGGRRIHKQSNRRSPKLKS